MVIQISVRSLLHRRADTAVSFVRNWLAIGEIGKRKETRGKSGKRFVIRLKNFFKNAERLVTGLRSERVQSDNSLSRIVNTAFGRFGIDRSREIKEIAICDLAGKKKRPSGFFVGKFPPERFVERDGVSNGGEIAIGAVGHAAVLRINPVCE